jgi:uncharacterized protein
MQFVVYAVDKSGHAKLRADTRPVHLDYLRKHAGHIVIAGPILDEAGEDSIGSLLIMDFPDRAAVEAFAAGDPYAKAGLFASVRIRPWRKVFPEG